MASYGQNYDAQSYQVNPYQAPAQEMIQAIQTRNSYWDSAATSVKNAYQNYLNLDLTRQDNHERLNQLMVGVNQQLKQVTQTDLSLGENYGKALSVFDPIVKDDNIMGDNAITRHYKDQFTTAQSYRIKDNGKGYSETNVRDLANHLQDFANDPNAANWRQHYSARSFYTPYYDTAGEIRQIDKEFKPDTKTLSGPMSLDKNGNPNPYMMTTTDKSIIASQYRAFLDAHLSDKAKEQLAIDGRVKYHGNIGALAQDYTTHNQDKINYYNNEIKDLNGKLAGATDGQKDAYTSQVSNYQALVKELNLENTKMSAGDFSNLTPYKDQIASSLYTNNYTDYVAKASAQKNISIKYTPDQVWKTMYQESNENKRFNIAKQTQWDIAQLNNSTKLDIARFKLGFGFNNSLTGMPEYATSDKSNDQNFGRQQFDTLQSQSAKDFQQSVDQMNKKIASDKGIDPNDEKVPKATRDAAVASWMADPRNKADVAEYNAAAQKKSSEDQLFNSINDYVNKQIQKGSPSVFAGRENIINGLTQPATLNLIEKTSNVKSVFDATGKGIPITLSGQDMQKILRGTNPNMKLDYEEETTLPSGMGGTAVVSRVPVLKYNGKNYYLPTESPLGKAYVGAGKADQEFESKRNDLLNQNINRVMGREALYQDDKNPYYKAVHELVARTVMGSDEKFKKDDVAITDKDRFGNVYFKVQADKDTKNKEIRTRVEAEGGRYIEADDKFMLPGNKFGNLTNSNRFLDPKVPAIQTLVDFRSAATPNDRFNTVPQTWGNRNFQFKVDLVNGHPSYRIVDPYTGAQFGQSDSGQAFDNLELAASAATFLGNLNSVDYINKVKTVGGVPDYQQK